MTRPDRTKAERALAFVVSQIRPDWDAPAVLVALRKCSEEPLGQVAGAALYCAANRTDQRTPDCIALEGDRRHGLDRMPRSTNIGSHMTRCEPHARPVPCMACQREADANGPPPATPGRIRAIREAAQAAMVTARAT